MSQFMTWLEASEGPAKIIATQIADNIPLYEGQMKVLKTLCFAYGMEAVLLRFEFHIYTNSMGGGSQTFVIVHDNEDVKAKVLAHLHANGLPIFIPRRFDTNKFLNTKFPHMIARGEIQYEDGPRNGNGGMVFSANYLIDMKFE